MGIERLVIETQISGKVGRRSGTYGATVAHIITLMEVSKKSTI
jgi:hypothetical protein